MTEKTILVAGGAGYIGTHTLICLYEAGYRAVCVDNLYNSSAEAMTRVSEIVGETIPFYQQDVRDFDALQRIFAVHQVDGVINFAGLKAVGESVAKPVEYYDNNLNATLTLVRAMRDHDCHLMIFSSSATVYGADGVSPLKDGEDPKGIPNNVMPYITQVAVGKLEKLHVFGDDYDTPDGTGVRDYIHVMDLGRGHVAAIDYGLKHRGAKAINLGTSQGYSVLELLHAMERACGKPIPYVIDGRRPGDIDTVYADASLARELLGWEARLGLDDMCRDSWNWQSQNPNGYAG